MPHAIDLNSAEDCLFEDSEADFTEAKEAIVEGLLRLTEQHCTGEGTEGEIIYGVRPTAKLVSGFLLPRYDQAGEDETSDIHVSTMGVDIQIAVDQAGMVAIRPSCAIYVRELPSWQEISDPRHEMMPQVQLSRDARQMVEQRARNYIQERIGALPPLDESEVQERAGEVIARTEETREAIDESEAAGLEAGGNGPNAGRTTREIARTADQDERVARAHQRESQRRAQARRERISVIAEIRREAFDCAFRELGIRLVTTGSDSAIGRPVASGDLDESDQSEVIEAGIETVLADEQDINGSTRADDLVEELPVAAGATGPLRSDVGRIDDQFAAPQPIPQKWRRMILELGEFRFDAADASTRQAAIDEFAQRFRTQVDEMISNWLAAEQGQHDAYRPNERVLPSQFADEESWNRYLVELRVRRRATLDDVRPNLNGVVLIADIDPDFADPSRTNLRIALQNDASMPVGRDVSSFEHAIFQVGLQVDLPTTLHLPLQLDRVQPSYRFREWLEYPAMGLNCGVEQVPAPEGFLSLQTTWAPRYIQPRIAARTIDGVPTSYNELSLPDTDVRQLLALPDAYDGWIRTQSGTDVSVGLPEDLADEEREAHTRDLDAYRRESEYIRAGIELLRESQVASHSLSSTPPQDDDERNALSRRAILWQAWLRTNETFDRYGRGRYTDWRLFQLAFILAHLPTFASRMEEFADRFDEFRDELAASLLYFPTGGGKSEAFFGLLVFNLFFDRLRGKHRGVTALVRYPLRLLTLQQARRLMRILTNAELVRLRHHITGWPFEIGFWVGSGNAPNRVTQGFGGVPDITVAAHADDSSLLNPPQGDTEADAAARRRSARYKEALEAYDKLRICPCCGSDTGMRKFSLQHGRIGVVCFNDRDCAWNTQNSPLPHRVPLPFLLTDDTIYQRAPSVVLGTVDKSALIGQHDRTINAIVGMFGCARYIDPQSRHFFMPRGDRALAKAEDEGWTRLQPSFSGGAEVFHDPFPSLIIQDEGHLLDESLGTFSGLFETTLEAILTRLGEGLLRDYVATWPSESTTASRPRLAKVIAATATISDPDRQLRVLYQREPLRFPCPGPNLYESFYAAPQRSKRPERRAYSQTLLEYRRPEATAPRMRTYMSIMTNGRSHTMTTSAVVSAYHLTLTRLWRLLEEGRARDVADLLAHALRTGDPLTLLRRQALDEVVRADQGTDILATLLDLLRISLTYVTNKKGGDQIIETLAAQVERDQKGDALTDLPFITDLISGGVTIAEIQDVMARAEGSVSLGHEFPNLGETLRNQWCGSEGEVGEVEGGCR